ncbi:MAG: hypothetical protein AAFU85_21250 [Planctomycetota bacterium]
MTYHQHQFESVQDYLHHRAPYLMVDSIESIDDESVITRTTVAADAFFIQGHFPGAPILPGAMMQEMSTQSAGILIAARYNPMESYNTHDPYFNEFALGVLVKVKQARFRGFARPGNELCTTVRLREIVANVFEFSATIDNQGQTIMKNAFQLTNIPSATLRG